MGHYSNNFDLNSTKISLIFRRTVLYLHFVNADDNQVMEVDAVLALIDRNHKYLHELYQEFHVILGEASAPTSGDRFFNTLEDQIKAGLVGASAFLLLLLVLVTCLCMHQKSRYKRQLKAASAGVYCRDAPLSRANVPNTNIHADEGSNPIWMTGYDNQWYDKEDEQMSHASSSGGNSLDENAVCTPKHRRIGQDGSGGGGVADSDTPTDSLNGSGRGSHLSDRQALCRGIGGRLTPNNIAVPSSKGLHRQPPAGGGTKGQKQAAPRPPGSEVTCNSKIYISPVYSQPPTSNLNANNLSIINLETTEL